MLDAGHALEEMVVRCESGLSFVLPHAESASDLFERERLLRQRFDEQRHEQLLVALFPSSSNDACSRTRPRISGDNMPEAQRSFGKLSRTSSLRFVGLSTSSESSAGTPSAGQLSDLVGGALFAEVVREQERAVGGETERHEARDEVAHVFR